MKVLHTISTQTKTTNKIETSDKKKEQTTVRKI